MAYLACRYVQIRALGQPVTSPAHSAGQDRSRKVVWAALAGNLAIALSKMAAAWLTGSSAMWSEAIHSMVDMGNQCLMLLGMHRAARPPSQKHPFGHGMELYFWSFVVAILIFGLGAGASLYQGMVKLRSPEPLRDIWVSYAVFVVGVLFEGAVWLFALRAFRRSRRGVGWLRAIRASKDPTVFTVLFEDTAALLGLLFALAGITAYALTDNPLYDSLASLCIGLVLAATAVILANECRGLLVGEAVARPVRDDIMRLLERQPEVLAVHRVLTMHFAPNDVLLTASLAFEEALTAPQMEEFVERVEATIRRRHPEFRRIFLEPRRQLSDYGRKTELVEAT
ncbi:MAG TPA: cation diffusion facilitator family transporter [Dyella sp.]|uniref:cation diffusion facilitator family transporter n=1 Tax=Dyella sp. TaxID=1869338 RepID=UPI002F94CC43